MRLLSAYRSLNGELHRTKCPPKKICDFNRPLRHHAARPPRTTPSACLATSATPQRSSRPARLPASMGLQAFPLTCSLSMRRSSRPFDRLSIPHQPGEILLCREQPIGVSCGAGAWLSPHHWRRDCRHPVDPRSCLRSSVGGSVEKWLEWFKPKPGGRGPVPEIVQVRATGLSEQIRSGAPSPTSQTDQRRIQSHGRRLSAASMIVSTCQVWSRTGSDRNYEAIQQLNSLTFGRSTKSG